MVTRKSAATVKKPKTPPPPKKQPGLNDRQRRFVTEYLLDHNATAAYKRAGYTAKDDVVASAAGSRLLGDVRVRAEIDRVQEQRLERVAHETGITLERVVAQIGRLAFFDPRALCDEQGHYIPLHKLPYEAAVGLRGLEVAMESQGADAEPIAIRKVKYVAQEKALDMLMQYLNGYKKHQEAATSPLAALLQSMKRSTLPVAQQPEDAE